MGPDRSHDNSGIHVASLTLGEILLLGVLLKPWPKLLIRFTENEPGANTYPCTAKTECYE